MDLTQHRPTWANDLGPGVWSDLVVSWLTGTDIEDHGSHLIVRTLSNPTYFWGNYVEILDQGSAHDVDRWLARFEECFPQARHRTFGLPGPIDAAWTERGFRSEEVVTLIADGPVRSVELPHGFEVRQFGIDAPFDDVVTLYLAENAHSGRFEEGAHREFLERQQQGRARLVADGVGRFFGVYRGTTLVSHLGIVRCGDLARYQSVLTDAECRGQGLAGHLVGQAAQWARRDGTERLVIVTDHDNPAGRLYRWLGFDGTAPAYGVGVDDVSALRPAPDAD